MTAQLPNIRLTTATGTNFPLSPVAGTFEVLDHNGIERPADSVRVYDAAIKASMSHTYLSRTFTADKAVSKAVVAAGWSPLVFLGSKVVRYAGGKRTAYIFGTSKA